MNRAERRRNQKAKEKVHVITHDDMMFDKGFRMGMAEGIRTAAGEGARMMTTCIATILNREFGFGAQRLDRALLHMTYMLETFQGHQEREVKARMWIKDRTGLDLDDYTGARIFELRDEMQRLYDMGQKIGAKDEDDNDVGFSFGDNGNLFPASDQPMGARVPWDELRLDHLQRMGQR